MKYFTHSVFFFLVAAWIPIQITYAQPFDDQNGPAVEKIKQLRRIKIIEALDLTEEQSLRLFTREKDHKKEKRELMDKRMNAISSLHKMLTDGATDEQLLAGVKKVQQLGTQMHAKQDEYILSLKDILSVEQIAKLVVFEDRFMKEIRDVLDDIRKRRKPPHMPDN